MVQTKAQKEIIRGQLEQQAIARRKEYLLTVPKRLASLAELAKKLGICVEVKLTETGPLVKFTQDSDPYFDDAGSYDMDEWELDELERRILRVKELEEERVARFNAAVAVWANLTEQEREGIKENINRLPK